MIPCVRLGRAIVGGSTNNKVVHTTNSVPQLAEVLAITSNVSEAVSTLDQHSNKAIVILDGIPAAKTKELTPEHRLSSRQSRQISDSSRNTGTVQDDGFVVGLPSGRAPTLVLRSNKLIEKITNSTYFDRNNNTAAKVNHSTDRYYYFSKNFGNNMRGKI